MEGKGGVGSDQPHLQQSTRVAVRAGDIWFHPTAVGARWLAGMVGYHFTRHSLLKPWQNCAHLIDAGMGSPY